MYFTYQLMMSLINHFSLHSPLQAGQRTFPLPRQFEHLKQKEHSCEFCNVFKIVLYYTYANTK